MTQKEPNQAPEPTTAAVTPRASAFAVLRRDESAFAGLRRDGSAFAGLRRDKSAFGLLRRDKSAFAGLRRDGSAFELPQLRCSDSERPRGIHAICPR